MAVRIDADATVPILSRVINERIRVSPRDAPDRRPDSPMCGYYNSIYYKHLWRPI